MVQDRIQTKTARSTEWRKKKPFSKKSTERYREEQSTKNKHEVFHAQDTASNYQSGQRVLQLLMEDRFSYGDRSSGEFSPEIAHSAIAQACRHTVGTRKNLY